MLVRAKKTAFPFFMKGGLYRCEQSPAGLGMYKANGSWHRDRFIRVFSPDKGLKAFAGPFQESFRDQFEILEPRPFNAL